ncbi:MAG: GGDEF domain-containing protein [Lachnospiraceae bacterium]|nr:GGDEF domain-containing protein [Lachnospiraceae bacterium]
MKKIALIMDGWKQFFTYAWPSGILQRMHETNEEVNLYIFNSSGNWSKDEDYNIGEYNIYRLPNLDDFDGIILDLNNVACDDVRNEIINKVKQSGVPVITIGMCIEDFYYVGLNNYEAMRNMIEHLHICHGARKYWFIMGSENNYENEQRVLALKDYMKDNDISYDEEAFYYGNFEYQSGVDGFKQLYSKYNCLPEAIICASDNIAVGVCESVKALGFKIPEDVMVTGVDNFDKAECYEPRITTLEQNREEIGYHCAELFLRLWAGEDVPQCVYNDIKCIFWDSCGCENKIVLDAKTYLKNQIMYGIETNEFDEEVLFLEYELMQCETVNEMMKCIPQCMPSMKCDAMYLVLDEHIDVFKNQTELIWDQQLIENEGFQVIGYPEKMKVSFAYENGKLLNIENMQIDNIFPMFDYDKGGESFLFLPIHFRSKTVGYIVIRNAVYLMEKQYLFQVIKALTTAIENLHKKEKLEYMNQMLSELYIRDSMTGMYNRFGYQRLAVNYFKDMHKKGKSILIMFIDMDRLKYINDNLGHEFGDLAIVTTANAILKHCRKDAVPVRNGGDEFILVQEAMPEKEINELKNSIQQELSEASERMNLPIVLSVSVGAVITSPTDARDLEDYVKEADEMMYQEKVKKKMERK